VLAYEVAHAVDLALNVALVDGLHVVLARAQQDHADDRDRRQDREQGQERAEPPAPGRLAAVAPVVAGARGSA
jgi:hypothetical protein